jgi:hypothetical protein
MNGCKWIYARLAANADVNALIGAAPSTRCRKVRAKQNETVPYVVYRRVGSDRPHAHDGPVNPVGARFELDCYAATGDAAEDLATKVAAALRTTPGQPTVAGGVTAQACLVEDDADDVDAPVHGDEVGNSYVTVDCVLWLEE